MGKICSHCKQEGEFGHNRAMKDGLSAWCKACFKAYRTANRESLLAAMKADYQRNREERMAKASAWYAANREHVLAQHKAPEVRARNKAQCRRYRQRHREERLAWDRRYHAAHAKERYIAHIAWRKRNHTTWRRSQNAGQARRRAREMAAPGVWTAQDVLALHATQGGLCAYCHRPLDGHYHVEHKMPLSRGGTNWPDNLCLACPSCNFRKQRRTHHEFLAIIKASS